MSKKLRICVTKMLDNNHLVKIYGKKEVAHEAYQNVLMKLGYFMEDMKNQSEVMVFKADGVTEAAMVDVELRAAHFDVRMSKNSENILIGEDSFKCMKF